MSTSDLVLDVLCGTRPRAQVSSDLAASNLKRRAALCQRVLKRVTTLQPYFLTIGSTPSFVWYRNAKVCTRSIYAALVAADVDFVVEHAGNVRVPLPLISDRFSFAFVRDPRTRIVSCWQNKVVDHNGFDLAEDLRQELQTFEAFVDWISGQDMTTCNKHYRLQSQLLDLPNIDFIGRFENFGADFDKVCSTIGITPVVEHRNSSHRREPVIGPRVKALLEDLYRDDLEAFSY